MTLTLGIDPGRGGALVLIDHDARFVAALNRHEGVPVVIAEFLRPHAASIVVACVEKAGYSPHNGKMAAKQAGIHLGVIRGILAALAIPLHEVHANAWQDSCGVVRPAKTAGMAGNDRQAAKEQSAYRNEAKLLTMQQALARWPQLPIKAKRDWDIADAAYLAEYARKIHLGQIRPVTVSAPSPKRRKRALEQPANPPRGSRRPGANTLATEGPVTADAC